MGNLQTVVANTTNSLIDDNSSSTAGFGQPPSYYSSLSSTNQSVIFHEALPNQNIGNPFGGSSTAIVQLHTNFTNTGTMFQIAYNASDSGQIGSSRTRYQISPTTWSSWTNTYNFGPKGDAGTCSGSSSLTTNNLFVTVPSSNTVTPFLTFSASATTGNTINAGTSLVSTLGSFTQSNSSNQPKYITTGGPNNGPYIQFNNNGLITTSTSAQYMTYPSFPSFSIANGCSFVFTCRMNSPVTGYERLLEISGGLNKSGTDYPFIIVYRNSATLQLCIWIAISSTLSIGSAVSTNNAFIIGQWATYAITFSNTTGILNMYVNGSKIFSNRYPVLKSTQASFTSRVGLLGVSQWNTDSATNFDLSSLSIYQSELTQSQIASISIVPNGIDSTGNLLINTVNSNKDTSGIYQTNNSALQKVIPISGVTFAGNSNPSGIVFLASSEFQLLYPAANAFNDSTTSFWHAGSNGDRSWSSVVGGIVTYTTYPYDLTTGTYQGGGVANTFYTTGVVGLLNSIGGEWLQVQLPIQIVLKTYGIGTRIGFPNRFPKVFTVCGSNDGITWFSIDQQSLTTNPITSTNDTGNEILYVCSTNTNPYYYHRIIIQSNFGDCCINITKFNLYTYNNIILNGGVMSVTGNSNVQGRLNVLGDATVMGRLTAANGGIKLTNNWSGLDNSTYSELSNDTTNYKSLMILGNKSNDGSRRKIGMWDDVAINGNLSATGDFYAAGNFYVDAAKQLCIGTTCVTKADLDNVKRLSSGFLLRDSYSGNTVASNSGTLNTNGGGWYTFKLIAP